MDGVVSEAGRVLAGLGIRLVEDGGHAAVGRGAAGFAGVEVAEAFGEIPAATRAVRAFVTDNHRKRAVAVFLHPLDREVGAHVVEPALGGRGDTVDFERAVHEAPVANDARGVIEARTLAALVTHVPLADVGGLVTGGAQQRGVGDGIRRKRRAVVGDAVDVIVAAREKRSPARSAERKGDEGVAEAHALGGEPVHVGRLEPREARPLALLALHDAHRVPAVIVGVEEQEVGLAFGGVCDGSAGQRGRQPRRGAVAESLGGGFRFHHDVIFVLLWPLVLPLRRRVTVSGSTRCGSAPGCGVPGA